MKNIIFVIVLASIFGCTKESYSPREQVVDAIHTELKYIPESPRFHVLKNDLLCGQMDCNEGEFTARGSRVVIYSREDLFMRAIDLYFEVVEWKESPRVIIRNHTGKQLSDELIIQRCKGT